MEEKNPFDIVMKLVAEGEIDPWNIDITILADKFLQELKNIQILDLKYVSKVILVASILLKMKAESLKIVQQEQDKKISRKRVFGIKRFYTLEEIAYLLKDIVQEPVKVVEKITGRTKRKQYKKPKRVREGIDFKLIKGGFENALSFLEEELKYIVGVITLSQLNYPYKPHAFMALLFLDYDNKVNIYQERHFDEIFIEPVTEISHLI